MKWLKRYRDRIMAEAVEAYRKAQLSDPITKLALEAAEQRRKQEEMYRTLKTQPLSYEIIRDLCNSAQHGIVIEAILADGAKLIFRREEAFDQLEKLRKEAW